MIVDRSRLPTVIVVGVQKCGTTSLHHYLRRHPQVAMSRQKELDFFIEARNWPRGVEWYARHFDPSARARGESSPNYTALRRYPGVAERMRRVVPDVRVVFMVRDPIERLISHWVHNYAHGSEHRPLHAVLDDDLYLERSRYAMQLRPYLDAFPRGSILILETGELRRRRRDVMRRVFAFIGVDPAFWSERYQRELHRSGPKRRKTALGLRIFESRLGAWVDRRQEPWRAIAGRLLYLPFSRRIPRPRLGDDERRQLADRLRPDIDEFRTLTQLAFDRWSV